MSTTSNRREGVPAAAAPRFFKIIIDPKAVSLRIPDEFIRRIGHNLPNPVFLKVPSGSIMEVELIHSNGKTMLRKGWQEFKERYSIGFGHFLVFEYNGNSLFNVLIFDTTASEINYPFHANYKRIADQEPKLKDNGTESDDSVVFLEEFSTGNRGKGLKAENLKDTQTARQQNRKKSECCDDVIEISEDYRVRKSLRAMQNLSSSLKKDSRSKCSSPNYRSECIMKLDDSTSEECSDGSDRVQMQRSVVKESCIAYTKAIAFVSDHTPQTPFFICLMHQSYVSYGFTLNVPVSFAKRNLPCRSRNLNITMVTNGKKWSVKCIVGNGCAKLSAGWMDFVQDNGLKVGDACIFEMAKSDKFVWTVVIFRS